MLQIFQNMAKSKTWSSCKTLQRGLTFSKFFQFQVFQFPPNPKTKSLQILGARDANVSIHFL